MNKKLMAVATAFTCAVLYGSAVAAAAAGPGETSRDQLTRAVIQKWSTHVDKTFPMGADAWSVEMAPAFAEASIEELKAAAGAKTFEEMNTQLLGGVIGDGTQALGDIDADLVFVPVTPCRIIDTRVAGGAIAANTVRSFDVTAVGNYAFQGGEANNCNGVGAAGSFAAAAINFTVVTPDLAGYITAFPFLGTQPLAATVNYTAGDIRGNYGVVKLDQGASANELSVYTFAQTHLVADIVGYYTAPVATPLECEEKISANLAAAAGGGATGSTPACSAGYVITGGSCASSTFDGRVVTTRTQPNTNTHFCAFRNEGAGAMTGVAYSVCCRIPGR